MTKSVFLALPFYRTHDVSIERVSRHHHVASRANGSSLLCYNFNLLWTEAINSRKQHGLTDFVMQHNDIMPEPYWLDKLIAEKERVGADVLSVIAPIKDERGLTSTGHLNPTNNVIKRFTMREVFDLPETFEAKDTPYPNHPLMINTGLLLVDFRAEWVERLSFSNLDGTCCINGVWYATCVPEDWHFSQQCARLGKRVFATRCVSLSHGSDQYRNDHPWGTWTHDEEN